MQVCAAPSGRVFAPFWTENGYTLLVWNRVWFLRELRECMNVFIFSILNEKERNRNMRIRNGFGEFFCLRCDLSTDNIISA